MGRLLERCLMKRITVSTEKCVGCQICRLMCALSHHGGDVNPRKALMGVLTDRIQRIDPDFQAGNTVLICHQCEPAPCAEACPADAFDRDEANQIWIVDADACVGCEVCAEECPYDRVLMYDEIAMKCDLCGGQPMCVQYCPTGALSVE